MARKRKLDASLPDAGPSAGSDTPAPASKGIGGMGGMWAGSAMGLLQQRIDEVHGSLAAGVMNGTVVLELDPSQLTDTVGSDRIGNWELDDDFLALRHNIERRGQTQPIRVRPLDPGWTPDPREPLRTEARFVVQSGRRRIEACRQLGRGVLAVLSTETGDAALADLEERFHENTMRRNLNGFEELLSIGLLAESLKDLSQDDIAARLSVSQNDVSLGLSCMKFREEILAQVKVATTPKREYRAIIPRLRRGESLSQAPSPAIRKGRYTSGPVTVEARPTASGVSLKVTFAGDEQPDLEELARRVGQFLSGADNP